MISKKDLERKERFEIALQEKIKKISTRETSILHIDKSVFHNQINHTRNKIIAYNKVIGNFCENCDGYNKNKKETLHLRNPFHEERKCQFINRNEESFYCENKIIKGKSGAEYPIFPLPRNWFF